MPPRKRKRRPRHHRVTTVSSTGNFLAPRSARCSDASQTQPGGRRAEDCGAEGSLAGCGARAARSKTCGARAAGQASAHLAPRSARRSDAPNAAGLAAGGSWQRCQATAPRSALRASLGRSLRLTSLRAPRVARTPQTQPGGQRAEACGATGRLPGCGARAFKRSLAEVVRDGAVGERTLARALPRSYDRAWARRAGAPAPDRLRRPPWAAATQTARLAFAHAAEDGRAHSEPESALPASPARRSTRSSECAPRLAPSPPRT